MNYKIVQANDISKLETLVNDSLADGWKLQGGVNSLFITNRLGLQLWTYHQAMFKNEIVVIA